MGERPIFRGTAPGRHLCGAATIAGAVYRSAVSDATKSVFVGMRFNKWGSRFRSIGLSVDPQERDASRIASTGGTPGTSGMLS